MSSVKLPRGNGGVGRKQTGLGAATSKILLALERFGDLDVAFLAGLVSGQGATARLECGRDDDWMIKPR
jgi:hypothetical protein